MESAMYEFSIIIPVLHEEIRILALIDELHRQFFDESFEIIVVDGDPAGSTVREIHHPEVKTAQTAPGRGGQMNTGAKMANGEMLIFLHADTHLPDGAFAYIRRILADGRYAAGAFQLKWDDKSPIFRLLEVTASWRYRLTRIPYGDQAFFLKTDDFFRIGGFADIPLMEDLEFMRRIKRHGEQVHISRTLYVSTSARRWRNDGIVYSVLRTWTLASLYCLGVPPNTLLRYYRAHRAISNDT